MKPALILVLALAFNSAAAQFSQASRDSLAALSAADHEQMKKQIGITAPNRS
jgi:hypothetical protein